MKKLKRLHSQRRPTVSEFQVVNLLIVSFLLTIGRRIRRVGKDFLKQELYKYMNFALTCLIPMWPSRVEYAFCQHALSQKCSKVHWNRARPRCPGREAFPPVIVRRPTETGKSTAGQESERELNRSGEGRTRWWQGQNGRIWFRRGQGQLCQCTPQPTPPGPDLPALINMDLCHW